MKMSLLFIAKEIPRYGRTIFRIGGILEHIVEFVWKVLLLCHILIVIYCSSSDNISRRFNSYTAALSSSTHDNKIFLCDLLFVICTYDSSGVDII